MSNQLVEEFLLGFVNEGTREQHRRALRRLFEFVRLAGGPEEERVDFSALLPRTASNGDVLYFDAVDREFVRSFVAWRTEAGDTPGVQATQFRTVRKYFEFLVRRGILSENPAAGIRPPRVERVQRDAYWLDVHEFSALLAAADRERFPARDRAIITVAGVMALRPKEMAGLLVGDVQEEARRILVHNRAKTDEGYLGVPDVVLGTIRAYLADPRRQAQSAPYLFLDDWGEPYRSTTLTAQLKRLALRAGITRNVTSYMLRHSAATLLILGGGSVVEAQGLLRHKDLRATKTYTHGVDLAQLSHVQGGPPNQILGQWLRQSFKRRD